MTIDIHTHLGTLRMNIEDVTKKSLGKQVDLLIRQMDAFGIKKAVLTPVEPKISTDLYVEAAAIYPDRVEITNTVNTMRVMLRILRFFTAGIRGFIGMLGRIPSPLALASAFLWNRI